MSDEGITLQGTNFSVTASEKVSTGQYENNTSHVTLEGEIPHEPLTDEARADLKEQLLQLHGDLQAVLTRVAGNRTAEPEWENWSFQDDEPRAETDGGQPDE